ncbi:carbohydrate kinase family protein [Micrococcales bacterium 31B]|nr:carbohydrate kinase family protein [Micrococcales bacterium 31B]
MKIAVTGSIAMDHLMTFSGKFSESLVVDQLDKISLSFLVSDLEIRRGGVAPNICFSLGALGLQPLLVGSAGEDFSDYRAWLDRHGVETWPVHISQTKHTARFVATTDDVHAQIASFYTGAMEEARNIELKPIVEKAGGVDIIMISPNDPEAMLRHTEECRSRGYDFVADPSQQIAWMSGEQIRKLIDGAKYLFSNEYEAHLIEQKTGWSHEEILGRVTVRVITRGKSGATIHRAGREAVSVNIVEVAKAVEPTGVGDAFRAGFLAGLSEGLSDERCAQLGSLVSSYVVETVGTQEFRFDGTLPQRFEAAFGAEALADVAGLLDRAIL